MIEEAGRLYAKNENMKLAIPESLHKRYPRAKDREVILGIRPEHIYNKKLKGELKGAEAIEVNIDVVEPVGKEIILLASCGEIQFTICVDLQTNVKPHDTMEMLVDLNYMHIFNKETEEVYLKYHHGNPQRNVTCSAMHTAEKNDQRT